MVIVAKRLVLRLLAILEQVPLLSVWFLLCVALSYLDFGSNASLTKVVMSMTTL
jgi:hypothetical protein